VARSTTLSGSSHVDVSQQKAEAPSISSRPYLTHNRSSGPRSRGPGKGINVGGIEPGNERKAHCGGGDMGGGKDVPIAWFARRKYPPGSNRRSECPFPAPPAGNRPLPQLPGPRLKEGFDIAESTAPTERTR
jgi:hypothetical protein